jgi:ATP-dependent RNA helicase RhlE
MSYSARKRTLERFKTGRVRVLLATDLATLGLHIKGISHIVNFDMPDELMFYTHRIDLITQSGARGVAIFFCSLEERRYLRNIENLIRANLTVIREHPFRSPVPSPSPVLSGQIRTTAAPK